MNKILVSFTKISLGIIGAIFIIGVSVVIGLNSRFIYYYALDKYNLDKAINISREAIVKDFNILIEYLQNIFIEKLEFVSFPMSANGEYHFYEVKKIFIYIYLITIIIAIFLVITYIVNKKSSNIFSVINVFNYGVNILVVTIGGLLLAISINFSKSFEIFHKIFFNNNYWIFDEKTDPIINILPEEVFKLYAIYIIVIMLIFMLIIKGLYYVRLKNIKEKEERSISI